MEGRNADSTLATSPFDLGMSLRLPQNNKYPKKRHLWDRSSKNDELKFWAGFEDFTDPAVTFGLAVPASRIAPYPNIYFLLLYFHRISIIDPVTKNTVIAV